MVTWVLGRGKVGLVVGRFCWAYVGFSVVFRYVMYFLCSASDVERSFFCVGVRF